MNNDEINNKRENIENNSSLKEEKEFKKNKKIFTTLETTSLVIVSLIIGFFIGNIFNNSDDVKKSNIINDKYLSHFVENYQYIINNYYQKIDKEKLINSAIEGMMKSLEDPYSMYFNKEESNNFSITLDGSYEGLGVQIIKDEETGYMYVTDVLKKSPAEKGGLLPGDMIISINGNLSESLTVSEFSSIVQNSKDKTYKIKILREKEKIEIELNKNKITLDSVVSETYNINNNKVGYIYIGIFANNTFEQFKKHLEKIEKEKIEYLIIDVRGNVGGHLTSVDNILDLFLNSKQIMYQFEQNGKVKKIYATGKEEKTYKIILLGDYVSASASEVLIAGLKENLDSKFIGEKTYGKGTVQELVTLPSGEQYKLTVKKWLTPKGNWINETEGIEPDIKVSLDNKYYETYEDKDDSQLQEAIKYIKEN